MFLDTCFLIDLMKEHNRGVAGPALEKLAALGTTPLYASVFVVCELQAGARLSRHPNRESRRVELLTSRLEVVYPDATFPVTYGELEAYLRRSGTLIPVMDLLIGVTAKAYGLPLVTRDIGHYRLIPGLNLEVY